MAKKSNYKDKLAIVTISGDGTIAGNRMTSETSNYLSQNGHAVYAMHLAGKDANLAQTIRDNSVYANVVDKSSLRYNPLNQGAVISGTLMAGLRTCISNALADGAERVLYMEGDKNNFVGSIDRMVLPLLVGKADVTLAKRSDFGWKQFPLAQRIVEGAANRYLASQSGLPADTDFLYGPKGFTAAAVDNFNECAGNDWATITAPVVAAALKGERVVSVDVVGDPQDEYLKKYPFVLRPFPGQLAWRTLQCLPLVKATRQLKARLSP